MLLMGFQTSYVDPTVFLPLYDTDYQSRNEHFTKYISSEYVPPTKNSNQLLKDKSGQFDRGKGHSSRPTLGHIKDECKKTGSFNSHKNLSWQNHLPSCRNFSSVQHSIKPSLEHIRSSYSDIDHIYSQTNLNSNNGNTVYPEMTNTDEELLWTLILAIQHHLKCTPYESIRFLCLYWKIDSNLFIQLLLKTYSGETHSESSQLFYYKILSLIQKLKIERNHLDSNSLMMSFQKQFNIQTNYHDIYKTSPNKNYEYNYLHSNITDPSMSYFKIPLKNQTFMASTLLDPDLNTAYHPTSSYSYIKQTSIHPKIIEVWADDLEEEFKKIRDIVEQYHYVAIDTEFPGVVATATRTGASDYQYQTVKCNVDLLNVIQLGITFSDENGNFPSCGSTWQFNFKFDLEKDLYAQNSIELLKTHGIDFHTHQAKGIDIHAFGENIISSGLVMCDNIKWISFHGSYDFGYLLKLLTCTPLPNTEDKFFDLLHDHFPSFCDIKYLLRNCPNTRHITSLEKASNFLNIPRIGERHQAGSDSLVTCQTFLKLRELYFNTPSFKPSFLFSGVLYGLRKGRISKKPYTVSKQGLTNVDHETNS